MNEVASRSPKKPSVLSAVNAATTMSPGWIDDTAIRKAAKLLGAARNPMIVCGGGAQGASEEVSALSAFLQAPVLGYRRGRGVLDSRDPLSVTLPLGRELWGEADVVLGIGSRMLIQFRQWGIDKNIKIVRVDADAEEPGRLHKPAVALIGDAKLTTLYAAALDEAGCGSTQIGGETAFLAGIRAVAERMA